jgi:hypothetical protein
MTMNAAKARRRMMMIQYSNACSLRRDDARCGDFDESAVLPAVGSQTPDRPDHEEFAAQCALSSASRGRTSG